MKKAWVPYVVGLLLLWAVGGSIESQFSNAEAARSEESLCSEMNSVCNSDYRVDDTYSGIFDFSDGLQHSIDVGETGGNEITFSRISKISKTNIFNFQRHMCDLYTHSMPLQTTSSRFCKSEHISVLESLYTHGFYIYSFRRIII